MIGIGGAVVPGITGLGNPCGQIKSFQPGLLDQVKFRDPDIGTVRKASVMAVVLPGAPIPLRPV